MLRINFRCERQLTSLPSGGPPCLDHDLHSEESLELMGFGSVRGPDSGRKGTRVVEHDGVEPSMPLDKRETAVSLADDALILEAELTFEHRGRKALAPHAIHEFSRKDECQFFGGQLAVGLEGALQGGGGQTLPRDALEFLGKARQRGLRQRQPCRKGMPAKPRDRPGGALCHEVERVAHMKADDRACRTPQLILLRACENNRGAMKTVLEARCDDA